MLNTAALVPRLCRDAGSLPPPTFDSRRWTMWLPPFLGKRKLRRRSPQADRPRRRGAHRPWLEALEDRLAPSSAPTRPQLQFTEVDPDWPSASTIAIIDQGAHQAIWLSGTFTDPDAQEAHTVLINW